MNDYLIIFLIFLISFFISTVLVYGWRYLAIKRGWLEKAKGNRWSKRGQIAKYGGVVFFINFVIFALIFSARDTGFLVLVGYCACMFILGLVDDIFDLKAYIKFFVQICLSTLYIAIAGAIFPLFENGILDYALSLFWLIGITNALNLLDNMDGLAGGIASISSIFYIILVLLSGGLNEVIPLIIFLGSILGFLIFNFNPAKIFMGDAGSYFLGSFLASYISYMSRGYTGGLFAILFIPVFILFLPILDTSIVTFGRLIRGKPIYEGGIDHTSHRLVFMGLSEKKAVLMLYIFAAISGVIAVIIRYYAYPFGYIAIPGFMIFAGIIAAYLLNAFPEDKQRNGESQTVATVILEFTYKQKIIEILLDVALVIISLFMSYYLRFEEAAGSMMNLFFEAMPVFIIAQLISNYKFGIYESVWRYASVRDLIQFVKASLGGAALSMLVLLYLYRFSGHSRSVYVLYAIIYFLMLSGSRASFKMLNTVLLKQIDKGKQTLLFGAGDAGELALREIFNNKALGLNAIGFIDDDPLKRHRKIHGLKVLGNGSEIEKIIKKYNIASVIITTKKIDEEYKRKVIEICRRNKCEILEVEFEFKLKLGNETNVKEAK
jgi:UDP-GlcNAc:undecaprenyl-phosphate GlcNAc-1-phosphate transferase